MLDRVFAGYLGFSAQHDSELVHDSRVARDEASGRELGDHDVTFGRDGDDPEAAAGEAGDVTRGQVIYGEYAHRAILSDRRNKTNVRVRKAPS